MRELNCIKCEGQLSLLGQLGNKLWLRCVDCGMTQHTSYFDPSECEVECFE